MSRLSTVNKDENCIIHFRYATHGTVKTENAHPFRQGNVYFAHNGVLPIEADNDMTDSETFFIKTLYPAICNFGINSNQVASTMQLAASMSSRFAIMQGETVKMFGGFHKYEGCYYSNLRFMSFYNF
jgi:predicted glutamine amidotransferase